MPRPPKAAVHDTPPRARRRRLRVPWWAAVFALAFAARLALPALTGEPLLFAQQYLQGALLIVEHLDPWAFVLRSDAWHLDGGRWTVAPLYYLFAAAVFKAFGVRIGALQAIQAGLDALTAVLVGLLARAIAGRHGAWAGVAYALYASAIELSRQLWTENAHTVLLVGSFTLLARGAAAGRLTAGRAAGAGALLAASVLGRAVGLTFLPVAGAWVALARKGRPGLVAGSALVLAGAAVIAPWTLRNVFLVGERSVVESVSIFNLWLDWGPLAAESWERQEAAVAAEPDEEGKRARILAYAWDGFTRSPWRTARSAWANFRHLVRPEGLHVLLQAQEPWPGWRHAFGIALDDLVLLLSVPLFVAYLAASPPSPVRRLLGLWTAYYLLLVVVAFHTEVRYRSALMPFVIAGAAGGVQSLSRAGGRRGPAAGLVLGLAMVGGRALEYAPPAAGLARAWWEFRPVAKAIHGGDAAAAWSRLEQAAAHAPRSAWPWVRAGRELAHAGYTVEAAEAYERARSIRPDQWSVLFTRPRLLAETGRAEEAARALAEAHRFSTRVDSWLPLDVAWRELPPPRADEILLGQSDYGAVRGFHAPRGDHRWSYGRAALRLTPLQKAPAYDVTLLMASPAPSPFRRPLVRVRVRGGAEGECRPAFKVRPCTLRTPAPEGGVLVVELSAPTWSSSRRRPEHGVRVDGMFVRPASAASRDAPPPPGPARRRP